MHDGDYKKQHRAKLLPALANAEVLSNVILLHNGAGTWQLHFMLWLENTNTHTDTHTMASEGIGLVQNHCSSVPVLMTEAELGREYRLC